MVRPQNEIGRPDPYLTAVSHAAFHIHTKQEQRQASTVPVFNGCRSTWRNQWLRNARHTAVSNDESDMNPAIYRGLDATRSRTCGRFTGTPRAQPSTAPLAAPKTNCALFPPNDELRARFYIEHINITSGKSRRFAGCKQT